MVYHWRISLGPFGDRGDKNNDGDLEKTIRWGERIAESGSNSSRAIGPEK